MSWLTSWRLALRLARRDLLKHKARAVIALVMVMLPVFGVVAADILIQTADVSQVEGLDRTLGTKATAKIEVLSDGRAVEQGAVPWQAWGTTNDKTAQPATAAAVAAVIGQRTMVPISTDDELLVRTAHGREAVQADQVDGSSGLAAGLYRLTDGHWPTAADEVVVNRALRDRGVGDTLRVVGANRVETTYRIVGSIVDATRRSDAVAVGLPGAFATAGIGARYGGISQSWLVDGPSITWSQITQLNKLGVLVTDRQVASHPNDYPSLDYGSGDNTGTQVAVLIVVMALIEVVLLAGPAFAVGARKQQRTLALMVAAGGTPKQARRVIIAGGLLLGLSAALVGVAGGILAARLLEPMVQHFDGTWLGPFQVPWLHLVAVAAFGLVSALIACLVPAWIASRQNVVAVLAGRRGDAKPVRAFPVVGLVLFGVGVLMAVAGARGRGDLMVSWSAVVCVLGMVLLVPVVVSWVARAAGRFPLPVRFAARDAVRHRTRTTPAVAAVAATVAGVVALGISTSSDEKENRETYQPSLTIGNAAVTPSYDLIGADEEASTDWDRVTAVVRQHLPKARVVPVVGRQDTSASGTWTDVEFADPERPGGGEGYIGSEYRGGLGTDILVSDGSQLPPTAAGAVAPDERVPAALAAGKAVVFTTDRSEAGIEKVRITVDTSSEDGDEVTSTPASDVVVPALVLYRSPGVGAPVAAILPPAVAGQAGLSVGTVGLELDRPDLSASAEKDLAAALDDLATPAAVYVERGYEAEAYAVILKWVLAALAAMLMLGGTLTAMFLALADARPDLATLAAVGAEPRTRRSVGAAYTFVMAFVGAVLGMIVGFVPGLAITWPLTAEGYTGRGPFIEIPWLMIAVVVVGLPLLTAAIVGACTRSRLPMVSRLT